MLGMNTHIDPGLIILILFHLADKIAAVNKRKTIAPSEILIRTVVAQDRERIMLMAGRAAKASYGLHPIGDGDSCHFAFHGVAPVQMDEIVIRIHKIHGHRHHAV